MNVEIVRTETETIVAIVADSEATVQTEIEMTAATVVETEMIAAITEVVWIRKSIALIRRVQLQLRMK